MGFVLSLHSMHLNATHACHMLLYSSTLQCNAVPQVCRQDGQEQLLALLQLNCKLIAEVKVNWVRARDIDGTAKPSGHGLLPRTRCLAPCARTHVAKPNYMRAKDDSAVYCHST
jgi:hypothetical protein